MGLVSPTLRTARLRLRPFAADDEGALFAMHTDAGVLRYWDAPAWTEREQARRLIARSEEIAREGRGVRLAVERDRAFIGWCALDHWNADYRSAMLAYCYEEASWGHGYATEAARALLQWGFEELDLNRIQTETDTRNTASAHVLEKLGFIREGTLREDCIVDGVVSDSWVFGLLRREWQSSPSA